MENKLADHLFRHQYGKMVSILTSIFGLSNLELIEDAIQDTFAKAVQSWRGNIPENPEAWLTKAAKNRAVDLFRKLKAEHNRIELATSGPSAILLNELFLDEEIADSQLRMIFTACHPVLNSKDQIAFALKTISGFGTKEIASALLLKEETIKKRLARARKTIAAQEIAFEIPSGKELPERLNRVLEVIYLTFNEGFHSNNQKILIRKDLCGEAIRLVQLLLRKEMLRDSKVYALFALMCFHSARLESRTNDEGGVIDLKNQDRSKWYVPLMEIGNNVMYRATINNEFSSYHYEAAIAAEHLKARTFESTNWNRILSLYSELYGLHQSEFVLLNKAIVLIQLKRFEEAHATLETISEEKLEQRVYLYYGTLAEFYIQTGDTQMASLKLDEAISLTTNDSEIDYLRNKKASIEK